MRSYLNDRSAFSEIGQAYHLLRDVNHYQKLNTGEAKGFNYKIDYEDFDASVCKTAMDRTRRKSENAHAPMSKNTIHHIPKVLGPQWAPIRLSMAPQRWCHNVFTGAPRRRLRA